MQALFSALNDSVTARRRAAVTLASDLDVGEFSVLVGAVITVIVGALVGLMAPKKDS